MAVLQNIRSVANDITRKLMEKAVFTSAFSTVLMLFYSLLLNLDRDWHWILSL